MVPVALIVLFIIPVSVLYGCYVRVIKCRNSLLEAKSSIDVQFKKRYDLIPNILTNTKYNISNGQKNVWLFEIGKKYLINEPATKEYSGVKETRMLSGVMTGELNNKKWGIQKPVDFYSLKGVIENLFNMLGLSQRLVLEPCSDISYLHPGKSAMVKILGKNKEAIGFFGELHPILKNNMKL